MKMIKLFAIMAFSMCIHLIADAQNTPLFNMPVPDANKIKNNFVPRSFDASRLVTTSPDGSVRDFTKSPCYQEIGFNPNLPQEEIIAEYDYCESEKRKKSILTIVSVLLVVGGMSLIIRSNKGRDRSTGP